MCINGSLWSRILVPLVGPVVLVGLSVFLLKKNAWCRVHKTTVVLLSVLMGILWVLFSQMFTATFC